MNNQFERRILNKEIGLRLLGKFLFDSHNKIIQVIDKNRGLHKVIKTEGRNKYYYIFKNAPFYNGDSYYNKYAGYWESINLDSLNYCISNDIDFILIGYPSGVIYCLNPLEWKELAIKYNSIREIKDGRMLVSYGKLETINETIASIPLHKLKRFN